MYCHICASELDKIQGKKPERYLWNEEDCPHQSLNDKGEKLSIAKFLENRRLQ